MNVLVTGGAGYIGSHAALRLLEDGHEVTVLDDLSRGNIGAIESLSRVGRLYFAQGRIDDAELVEKLLRERQIDLVMHFAALAYVGESVQDPIRYYRNNAAGTLALLESMERTGVRRMVFSSTCATYGEPAAELIPLRESCPQQPINPYGRSKLFVEHVLRDYADMKSNRGEDFAFAALRYFNVAGSDEQARIGEEHDPETHLVPICLEAACGRRDRVTIFGADYDTPDGTCIRDYVHVQDLIDAHVTVMHALKAGEKLAYNVGIGRGYSVREVIEASRAVTGAAFATVEGERRPGDPPTLYADPSKIEKELGWKASFTELESIIESAWRWRQSHPDGYNSIST